MAFRVIDFPPDGPAVTATPATSDEKAAPPPAGTLRWIDLAGHAPEAGSTAPSPELVTLQQRFDFHPLTIEDCGRFDQRPKLEEYGTYLFIVVHGFVCPDADLAKVAPIEVHAFLGKDYLVTVHDDPIAELETVWKRVAGDPALGRRGADFLYYLIVDEMVDRNFALLDQLSDKLDDIEDAVLDRAERTELTNIFSLKRTLVIMRRTLSPQRDVFAMLAKRGDPRISERTSVYFRDVYDHLTRIYESIDTARDLLGNALDAYLSMVAQRTNDVMKRLTILSAVFLPLTFVTGFFGQNFDALPIHTTWLFYMTCALCGLIPAGMLYWFRRSKWL